MDRQQAGRRPGGGAVRLLLLLLTPVVIAFLLSVDLLDLERLPVVADEEYRAVAGAGERLGDGFLPGPEDLAYDEKEGIIYTGCDDGWIKRIPAKAAAGDGGVEEWVRVGGRPLGVALSPEGNLVVAEAYKGLLKVGRDGDVRLLADEAEGLRFGLTDGVDVASDGLIYFTDASYKYHMMTYLLDILEGRPYGRLMSYDPSKNVTTVLARDLYFANGVSLAPDQQSLIFCESPMRRCSRYHIKGEKKNITEKFVENLPFYPDNIRYDREGRYIIGFYAVRSPLLDLIKKYYFLRKIAITVAKFVKVSQSKKSGAVSVDLDGRIMTLYTDSSLLQVTGGVRVGNHLYLGSISQSYILRIDLTKLTFNV